jgi:TolB-like protein
VRFADFEPATRMLEFSHARGPMPRTNMGGGEEHDYFVDGITESLTTDLARILGAFVIGRNTAFTYKTKRSTSNRSGANSKCAMS